MLPVESNKYVIFIFYSVVKFHSKASLKMMFDSKPHLENPFLTSKLYRYDECKKTVKKSPFRRLCKRLKKRPAYLVTLIIILLKCKQKTLQINDSLIECIKPIKTCQDPLYFDKSIFINHTIHK